MGMRRLVALAGPLALACALSACSSTPTRSVVALGDSVPRGTNCDCTPYPELNAKDLGLKPANDSVAGANSADVLEQVHSDDAVAAHLKDAGVVEIEVGANDVAHSSTCGDNAACYEPKIPTIEKNLTAIVERVHEVDTDRHVRVVLLDYWSVWLGGQYAAAHGPAYVDAAASVTADVDAVIKQVAKATGSGYVDLRAAFKGPNYAYDETHYLSNDGDHPNAAGHRQIASAAEALINGM